MAARKTAERLTAEIVQAMRKQHYVEGLGFTVIAKKHGVPYQTARQAIIYETWAHVPDTFTFTRT